MLNDNITPLAVEEIADAEFVDKESKINGKNN